MASGSSNSKEVQKRLEEEITCPICQDHFKDPKILPCLHYYCQQCIHSLALRAGEDGPFACPECRSDTCLPQNDPSRLPTAFFINRMKDLHTKMGKAEGKVEALCEQCSGDKATAFCRDCTEFICEGCVKIHQKIKVFAGHRVTGLEELKKGERTKEVLVTKASPRTCKIHENEIMKIYCFNCDSLICRDCTIIDHKEHKFDFVKTSAPKVIEMLVENLSPLKEIQLSLCHATETVRSTKSEIEAQGATVAATIEQLFNEIHKIIDQRKFVLLQRAASVTKEKIDHLNAQEKGFELAVSTIQSLVDLVELNIQKASEEEVMSIHTQIVKRISEETEKHKYSNTDLQPSEKANMVVEIDRENAVKKVIEEKTNLLEFSLDGPGKRETEVGKPAFVRLSCKSMNPVCIESKLTSAQGTLEAKVQRKNDDVYEIEYAPKVRGRQNLEIIVNGLSATDSPYPVFVKIPPTQLGKPLKVIDGLESPLGVAINSTGNIIVAEENGVIRVLDKDGKIVNTLENTQHNLKRLHSIAVDKRDNIYLTDNRSHKLYKFNSHLELVTVVGREKRGVEECNPWGIAVAGEKVVTGSRAPACLYIFDTNLNLCQKVDLKKAGVSDVIGITSDDDMNLYICDYGSRFVHVLSLKGQECELLYSFGKEHLQRPHSICISHGLIYVTDWKVDAKRKTIFIFNKDQKLLSSFASYGSGEDQCRLPSGLAVDSDGYLYVCDSGNKRLKLF